jgi:hypothetical protein
MLSFFKKLKNKTLIVVIFFLSSCGVFSPGFFVGAETYELETSFESLFNEVNNLKAENPELNVPLEANLKDLKFPENNDYYIVYFYFKQENEIIITYFVPSLEESKTIFGISGVNLGLIKGNWKYLNNDLSDDETEVYKKKFEDRILNPIKKRLKLK